MRLPPYLQLRACGHALVAVFTISLPLWVPVDEFGFNFVVGFTALLMVIAYWDYRESRQASDKERAYQPPIDASTEQQIAYYKKFLGFTLVSFPVLSIVTIYQLHSLQSGDETESVWIPVALAYEWGGYWPAALCVPVTGALIAGVFVLRIEQLKKVQAGFR
jgi:hypothetical protein